MTPTGETTGLENVSGGPFTLTASPGEPVRLVIPPLSTGSDSRPFSWSIIVGSNAQLFPGESPRSSTFVASGPGTYVVAATEDGTLRHITFVVLVVATTVTLTGPGVGTPNHVVGLTAEVTNAPDGAVPSWSATADGPDGAAPLVFEEGLSARVMPGDVGRTTVTFTLSLPDQTVVTRTHVIDVVAAQVEQFDPTDAAWWQDKQKSDTREALSNTVAAAGRWQGYGTALLSVFSTVALLSGPKTLAETDNTALNWIVVGVMIGAFVLAFIGLIKLSQVTAQAPKLGAGRTAQRYAAEYYEAAALAQSRFRGSKSLTMVAASLVGIGSLILVVVAAQTEANADKEDPPLLVIVRTSNETLCGELGTGSDGSISVAGRDIARSSSIVVVDSCG